MSGEIHFEITPGDLALIRPLLVLAATAALVLIMDLFRKGKDKSFAFWLTLLGLAATFAVNTGLWWHKDGTPFGGLLSVDSFSIVFTALLITAAILATFLSRSYARHCEGAQPEYYALILMGLMGMTLVAMAADLMMLFLGIELLSIPLYVLAAYQRSRRVSVEAGLKYFLLGAFASGFLLYGIALLYGASGTTRIAQLVTRVATEGPSALFLGGCALTAVGLAFKIAAAPFHMWAPDVYEGAPTPITAFMATAVKIAGFAAIIRVFAHLPGESAQTLASGAAALAVLTMAVGNLGALPQTRIKRMLAFSSVAHAGYLLVGVSAGLAKNNPEAYRAIAYYLAAYTFMNLGAFGVIIFLDRKGEECLDIDDLSGLSRRHPGLALAMAIFMFTLAGMPPSAGFFGKFYLFKAAVDAEQIGLAVTAVLLSVVSLFYYLRVITVMYLKKPAEEPPEAVGCPFLVVGTLVAVTGVFVLGILPSLGMDILARVGF